MEALAIMEKLDWDKLNSIAIDKFCWDFDFKPESYAKICILNEKGICVRMWSYEDNPVSVHKEINSNVYQDSCLEFFFNLYPEETNIYLNFEVNHRGAMLVQYGENRNDRKFLSELGVNYPEVKTFEGEDAKGHFWGIEYEISFGLLEKVYERNDLKVGHSIKAAFYKCGDKTGRPHYGSWQFINTEMPDFHCPIYFGTIILKYL